MIDRPVIRVVGGSMTFFEERRNDFLIEIEESKLHFPETYYKKILKLVLEFKKAVNFLELQVIEEKLDQLIYHYPVDVREWRQRPEYMEMIQANYEKVVAAASVDRAIEQETWKNRAVARLPWEKVIQIAAPVEVQLEEKNVDIMAVIKKPVKLFQPDDVLSGMVGGEPRTKVELLKALWAHIKANKLQLEDKSKINLFGRVILSKDINREMDVHLVLQT